MSPKRKFERFINLVVGGLNFCLPTDVIERFPDSYEYFAHLLKDEWNPDKTSTVHIDRDGSAFYCINYYLQSDKQIGYGYIQEIEDIQTLCCVKREADFYNLSELVECCDKRVFQLQTYWCKQVLKKPGIFELCDCVSECEGAPVDPAVRAMYPLRPSSIATIRLDSHIKDKSLRPRLKNMTRKKFFQFKESEAVHHMVDECDNLDILKLEEVRSDIRRKLHVWPLDSTQTVRAYCDYSYLYSAGGHSEHREFDKSSNFVGRMVYIYNTNFTGGTVSATVNGQTVSITRPGECMALAAGVTFRVDTVTSGELILLEYRIGLIAHVFCSTPASAWTVHNRTEHSTDCIEPCVGNNVLTSIDTCLRDYCGMVLCLTRYYTNRPFETDPGVLAGVDGSLYELLCAHYEVCAVTVFICKSVRGQRQQACVLDFTKDREDQVDLSATSKLRVVAPLYGYGKGVEYRVDYETVQSGFFLTGLMVTKR